MSITFGCLEKFDAQTVLAHENVLYKEKLYEIGFKKKCLTLVSTLSHSLRSEWDVHETTKHIFTCNKQNCFFSLLSLGVDLYLCAFHLVEHQNQHNTIGYWKVISPKIRHTHRSGMRRERCGNENSRHTQIHGKCESSAAVKWSSEEEKATKHWNMITV